VIDCLVVVSAADSLCGFYLDDAYVRDLLGHQEVMHLPVFVRPLEGYACTRVR
jgi:hypothetical protein